ANPMSLSVGDFNGDGKLDLAWSNPTGDHSDPAINMALNTSTSSGVSFGSVSEVLTGIEPGAMTVADFDGDGKDDITVSTYDVESGNFSLATLEHFAGISFLQYTLRTMPNGAYIMTAGNLTGHTGAKTDLVVEGFDPVSGDTTLQVLVDDGQGSFQ